MRLQLDNMDRNILSALPQRDPISVLSPAFPGDWHMYLHLLYSISLAQTSVLENFSYSLAGHIFQWLLSNMFLARVLTNFLFIWGLPKRPNSQ